MAGEFPSAGCTKLKPRKGHDMTWSCDKHAEPIKFYCKEDKIPICHPCATKDHKPCQLDDIEDVILEMRTKLDVKQSELDRLLQSSKRLVSKIQSCYTFVSNHLETVNAEVNSAHESKVKRAEKKKQEDILQIHKEVDEKISSLNEERERRVASCIAEAEKEEQSIKEIHAKHLTESKKIHTTVGKQMEDLKSESQAIIYTITNVDSKIERIRQNDKTLVTEAPQVWRDESVSTNLHQHNIINARLAEIRGEIEKYVESKLGGKQHGKWEPDKSSTIMIPLIVQVPLMCGVISDDEVCVTNTKTNDLYVLNIRCGDSNKVIQGDSDMRVTSCAPIDSDLIVCGKGRRYCNSNQLDGYITIYDRQWKVVRDIKIPWNPSGHNEVYVDVYKGGMILAAQLKQSNIYVINPADGKIVYTITMQGNDFVWGEIQALSSGDIVVKTDLNRFTVISRSEEVKATIQHDEWDKARFHVDKPTDTLYITYQDKGRRNHTVDQVSRDGDIQARSIVEYKGKYYSRCIITPCGNLIACDGSKTILVYKYMKTFMD